mmetsp:Transcript_31742/g.71689  ORF Transcript_31742/g.71689 Transcript_31742/m.71689 type:complete len:238 (+) Transcript_31742:205-918(+)
MLKRGPPPSACRGSGATHAHWCERCVHATDCGAGTRACAWHAGRMARWQDGKMAWWHDGDWQRIGPRGGVTAKKCAHRNAPGGLHTLHTAGDYGERGVRDADPVDTWVALPENSKWSCDREEERRGVNATEHAAPASAVDGVSSVHKNWSRTRPETRAPRPAELARSASSSSAEWRLPLAWSVSSIRLSPRKSSAPKLSQSKTRTCRRIRPAGSSIAASSPQRGLVVLSRVTVRHRC